MKISYRWLQEFVDCQHVPATQLAEMLTMAGLEVEGVEEVRFGVPPSVVVGEIAVAQRHPQAAELYVCQVQIGGAELLTIVCGAPNTRAGLKVPVALSGTVLPNGMTVTAATIKGVLSQGMLCAEDELGLSADHSGLIVLPEDAPVGKALTAELLSFEPEAVLEVSLTPNRGDCLSHLGVAREVATLLNLPLRKPAIAYPETGTDIGQMASVAIDDPDLCSRYTASLITGVQIAPSPLWLKRRLERIGVRSINNVVDVTNYVMMELGQPLHAFDFEKLAGRKIIVRRARADETFTTLDGAERHLDANILMIADGERSIGIGGVMGGLNSEVSAATTQILLESAFFAPPSIRSTSKKLGLMTEASYRFERTIDLCGVDVALRRATRLIAELAGGTVARGIWDVYPSPYTPPKVALRPQRAEQILGVAITPAKMQTILTQLGFAVLPATAAAEAQPAWLVEVPAYRSADVTREIDLIEEIGRIYGYDNIPTRLPAGEIPPKMKNPARDIESAIRNLLLSQGMTEALNYSFFNRQSLERLLVADKTPYCNVVPLKNPLSADQDVLRTTLIPGLLANVALNKTQRRENLRLFEVGKIFAQTDPAAQLPDEKTRITGVVAGARMDAGWAVPQTPVDFYDVKGIIENILQALGVRAAFRRCRELPFLHPGEAATIVAGDAELGFLGKLHPDVVEAFQFENDQIYLFELFLEQIVAYCSFERVFQVLPKFPAAHRDLAVVAPGAVAAADVAAAITEAGKPLLESVALFDRYVGPQIAAGAVGLTYALTYRSFEKTLTDDEVTDFQHRIVAHLHTRLGVALRQ